MVPEVDGSSFSADKGTFKSLWGSFNVTPECSVQQKLLESQSKLHETQEACMTHKSFNIDCFFDCQASKLEKTAALSVCEEDGCSAYCKFTRSITLQRV